MYDQSSCEYIVHIQIRKQNNSEIEKKKITNRKEMTNKKKNKLKTPHTSKKFIYELVTKEVDIYMTQYTELLYMLAT